MRRKWFRRFGWFYVPSSLAGIALCMAAATLLATVVVTILFKHQSLERHIDDYRQVKPKRFLLVMPQGRELLPCVVDFIAFKRGQGFTVDVLTFDTASLSPRERCLFVQTCLAEQQPPRREHAFLLFLASNDELPMGPWKIQGVEQPIISDLPLLVFAPAGSLFFSPISFKRARSARIFFGCCKAGRLSPVALRL